MDYPNVSIQKLKQILKYYNCCRNKRKRDSVSEKPKKKIKDLPQIPTESLKIRIPSETKIKIDEEFLIDLENADKIFTEINAKRYETQVIDKEFEKFIKEMGKKTIISILKTYIGLK